MILLMMMLGVISTDILTSICSIITSSQHLMQYQEPKCTTSQLVKVRVEIHSVLQKSLLSRQDATSRTTQISRKILVSQVTREILTKSKATGDPRVSLKVESMSAIKLRLQATTPHTFVVKLVRFASAQVPSSIPSCIMRATRMLLQ